MVKIQIAIQSNDLKLITIKVVNPLGTCGKKE